MSKLTASGSDRGHPPFWDTPLLQDGHPKISTRFASEPLLDMKDSRKDFWCLLYALELTHMVWEVIHH
jgi:hypothetical protein